MIQAYHLASNLKVGFRFLKPAIVMGSTPTILPSITGRHLGLRHLLVCFSPRSHSAPSGFGFGPLAYSLPLYHPIRLIEEICMLDQMSGGRLELGVGRGVSPFEVGFFGVNPADGSRQFPEALR